MQMALDLAAKAAGRTSPNPMVGAVLVKNGKVIGKGFHTRAGAPHAEIEALRDAGGEARGATLYVTLEPCCHFGKTGPCTEAIIEAGIKKVVIATTDPNPLVSGKGMQRLREAGLDVVSGVMMEEARKLNEAFNKYITTKLPFVLAKAAMSLDGKIATRGGESKWITGQKAREKVHHLRNRYDAVLVGVGTVLADDPSLTVRLPGVQSRDPARVILDSRARTQPDCKLLTQTSPAPTYIVVSDQAAPQKVRELKKAGAQVVHLPSGERGVDLHCLLKWLGEQEITSLLVEGGATVHGSFFAGGLVDKVAWFIAPKIIGGKGAPGPVGGTGIDHLRDASLINNLELTRYGEDILLEGYVVRQ